MGTWYVHYISSLLLLIYFFLTNGVVSLSLHWVKKSYTPGQYHVQHTMMMAVMYHLLVSLHANLFFLSVKLMNDILLVIYSLVKTEC